MPHERAWQWKYSWQSARRVAFADKKSLLSTKSRHRFAFGTLCVPMDAPDTEKSKLAAHAAAAESFRRGSAFEVLFVFLKLGVSSFGGPDAHLGYFREEFVARRRWIALCQFLPEPASSQVGFSVGLMRALYNPVWTSSVASPADFGIVAVGFVLLTVWRAAPLLVVLLSALAGIAQAAAM
jgi:hypothetical protein